MTEQGLTTLSATELVRAYKARTLSPVAVTNAILARIQSKNAAINAFVVVDDSGALEAARASEERWGEGKPLGLLDGVPVSVKDLLAQRGLPTRLGSKTRAEVPSEEDAPAVARLREHGAVLLGKTTTSEFGLKGLGDSPLAGTTRNPWDTSRTSGGSSAGAVAAVASGFGPLAVGTDGGGSIRVPSAFSGVVGFKPTFGVVPTSPPGIVGAPPHVGPIAHNVADAALLLSVLSGPDVRDPFRAPLSRQDYRSPEPHSLAGLTIGYSKTLGFAEVSADARPAAVLKTMFWARAAHTVRHLTPEQRAVLETSGSLGSSAASSERNTSNARSKSALTSFEASPEWARFKARAFALRG